MAPQTSPAAATPPPPPPPPSQSAAGGTALAPGFRFHPTDDELVSYYLKRKIMGKAVRFNAISEVDIYKSEPWELPEKSMLQTRDQEWYFFSALDKKYGNGARMNRATNQGYWKATGNDRAVRHDTRTVGLKKTLVFHAGRAPGGKRTDWVMHEYRLADEELEKCNVSQGYVLCRVFQKSGIGPPSGGSRYAPFVEEEWDDGNLALIPGVETADEPVAIDDASAKQSDGQQQDAQRNMTAPPNLNEPPPENQNSNLVCKVERTEDCPPHSAAQSEPSIIQYKRRRVNDPNSNHLSLFDNLTRAAEEANHSRASSVTAASTSATANHLPSALVEFSLMESLEPKECHVIPPPSFDSVRLDSVMPPNCLRLFDALRNEIHNISVERETLKLEMLSAQAMINILQSRIEHLTKENDDLRRTHQDRQ